MCLCACVCVYACVCISVQCMLVLHFSVETGKDATQEDGGFGAHVFNQTVPFPFLCMCVHLCVCMCVCLAKRMYQDRPATLFGGSWSTVVVVDLCVVSVYLSLALSLSPTYRNIDI